MPDSRTPLGTMGTPLPTVKVDTITTTSSITPSSTVTMAAQFELAPKNFTYTRPISMPIAKQNAVIADQLSVTYPNPAFIEATTSLLQQLGYIVTYLPMEQVTVDFFRTLPKRGDKIILLRAHSSVVIYPPDGGELEIVDYLVFATGEKFDSSKYLVEQQNGWLTRFTSDYQFDEAGKIITTTTEPAFYFGMGEGFQKYSMEGRFNESTIFIMGCDGLARQGGRDETANLFFARGARNVIGWSDEVTPEHMDLATYNLLYLQAKHNLSLEQAYDMVYNQLGPDPQFGAKLRFLKRQD